ncbi:hypothetical protein [Rhizobium ruizarguesonis]|uniref:hypothetical protein n=1 Tax=Rhizobium ruizarguesonis TaxID=2081791 RepID=UPI0013DF5962|nr:hypothetical protein [Rhizobium ruizarguesonis]
MYRPIATAIYFIVVATAVTGELADPVEVAEANPYAEEEHVWRRWRVHPLVRRKLPAIGAVAVIARGSPANFLSLVRTLEIV